MRFSWVPSISDSVVPFFVGILQFIMIESLGIDSASVWFASLAMVFAVMQIESHTIMRRARQDPDNAEFFQQINPATLRDAIRPAAMVLLLTGFAVYLSLRPDSPLVAAAGFTVSLGLLVSLMVFMNMFWKRTMGELNV
jgi:hypothetical protein